MRERPADWPPVPGERCRYRRGIVYTGVGWKRREPRDDGEPADVVEVLSAALTVPTPCYAM